MKLFSLRRPFFYIEPFPVSDTDFIPPDNIRDLLSSGENVVNLLLSLSLYHNLLIITKKCRMKDVFVMVLKYEIS